MPGYDVLVIGGGIAGLRATLAAKQGGAKVALISKGHPLRSHSGTSGGGINVALGSDDSWEKHALETVQAGGYLCDQDAVEWLCREAQQDVIRLDHMGVPFNRDAQGRLDRRLLGGASVARACFSADATGHVILQVLYEQLLREGITTYDEWLATALVIDDGFCRGVLALELRTSKVEAFAARAVILATGGVGCLYEPSTASLTCTGDGISLAYRVGVPLMDMEMVQYHPLVFKDWHACASEAVLGEGGYLCNKDGERFLSAGELAPRDVTCRAILAEIMAGRGLDGAVLLDLRHLGQGKIATRLPSLQRIAAELLGVDLAKDPLFVRPAMHRVLGGVATDLYGATAVPGLFAAGECAAPGVHGANALAGNTILSSVVFGRRAGSAAAAYVQGAAPVRVFEASLKDEKGRIDALFSRSPGGDTAGKIRQELARTMHERVGLVREEGGLAEAAQKMGELRERHRRLGIHHQGKVFNHELTDFLELGSLLDIAEAVIAAAQVRQESRGVHCRSDYSAQDEAGWLKHTLVSHTPEGPSVHFQPVAITRWQPKRRE